MARIRLLATAGVLAAVALAGGCNKQPDRANSSPENSSGATKAADEDLVPKLSSAEAELASELRRALDTVEALKTEVNGLREACFRKRLEGESYNQELRRIEERLKALAVVQKYADDRNGQLQTVREALDSVTNTQRVKDVVGSKEPADLRGLLAQSIVHNESTWSEITTGSVFDATSVASRLSVVNVGTYTVDSGHRRLNVKQYLETLQLHLVSGEDRGDLDLVESEDWLRRKLTEIPRVSERFHELPLGSVSDRMITAEVRRLLLQADKTSIEAPQESLRAVASAREAVNDIESEADRKKLISLLDEIGAGLGQWLLLKYRLQCQSVIQELWKRIDESMELPTAPTEEQLKGFRSECAALDAVVGSLMEALGQPGSESEVWVEDGLREEASRAHSRMLLWVANMRESVESLALRGTVERGGTPAEVASSADAVLRINPRNRYATTQAKVAFRKFPPEAAGWDQVRDLNLSAATLLAMGFTAKALSESGFPVIDLFRAGAPVEDCRALGIQVDELVRAGASVSLLRAAGFTWRELFDAGVSWDSVQALGPTLQQLAAAGVSLADARNSGATAKSLRHLGADWKSLKTAGYALDDLASLNATHAELYSSGYGVAQLLAKGASVAVLRGAGAPWQDLKEAGVGLSDLCNAGADYKVLESLGVSLVDARAADVPVSTYVASDVLCSQLLSAGWTLLDLVTAEFPWNRVAETNLTAASATEQGITVRMLRRLGASWSELRKIDFGWSELKKAGASIRELYECGASLGELHDLGASKSDLVGTGASREALSDFKIGLSDVQQSRASWQQLVDQGFSAPTLRDLGADWSQLRAMGAPWADLHSAGATWDDLKASGASRRDLVMLGAPFELSDFAPARVTTFGRDEKIVGVAAAGDTVHVFARKPGNMIAVLTMEGNEVASAKLEAEGRDPAIFRVSDDGLLVSLCGGILTVWDWRQDKRLLSVSISSTLGAPLGLACSAPAQTVVVLTSKGGFKGWNYASGKEVISYADGTYENVGPSLALSPDGRLCAYAMGNRVDVIDLSAKAPLGQVKDLPNKDIRALQFTSNSEVVWLHGGKVPTVHKASWSRGGPILAAAVSRGGSLVAPTDMASDEGRSYAVLSTNEVTCVDKSGVRTGNAKSKVSGTYMTYSRSARRLLVWSSDAVEEWTLGGQ